MHPCGEPAAAAGGGRGARAGMSCSRPRQAPPCHHGAHTSAHSGEGRHPGGFEAAAHPSGKPGPLGPLSRSSEKTRVPAFAGMSGVIGGFLVQRGEGDRLQSHAGRPADRSIRALTPSWGKGWDGGGVAGRGAVRVAALTWTGANRRRRNGRITPPGQWKTGQAIA